MKPLRIAILALQGAFAEHQQILQKIGVDSFLVRNLADWTHEEFDGLIIPGGESTAMLRIMNDEQLMVPVRNAIQQGLPVFGTCAGMILLAKEVDNETRERLATMDIRVHRNAYGRQMGSFYTEHDVNGIGTIPMTFIRAPYIEKTLQQSPSNTEPVEVLSILDNHIIAARQGNQLVCSFHPELNEDLRFHKYFISIVQQSKK
ncbi:MAG: pyridoxal 5'-phosphate synthase glutaminase subunit PdxT [Paludibacteraceae bacterium]|nr:pyridoxal 5'-phosphate synthase glutaminase subunit PdxT [Paludibacteraceae bacterium]MBR5973407.1 pyridoxal 5'-phosphate synthase glutaminase subunit PdxT [Paludibacteraceae bacterium]